MNNFKKIISIFILSAIIIPASGFAATTTSEKLNEVKQQRETLNKMMEQERKNIRKQIEKENNKNEIASTTQKLKENKIEIKNGIEQRIGKKLDEKRTNIANRFEEAIKNLRELLFRVETKIVQTQEKSIIAISTVEKLSEAKKNMILAENELTLLENKLAENISTSTRKTYLADIKTQSEKTKTSIKATHASIVNIIESLKPGQQNKIKATSTPKATSTKNN